MKHWIKLAVAPAFLAMMFAMAPIAGPDAVLEPASAQAQELAAVPAPEIPEATTGTECIREPEFMRRNHMDMLKHKRDLTVHDGNRLPDASLTECISCHAVKGDDGKFVTVQDSRHFCRSCHDYAAVKVDCFQCHASRPDADDTALKSSPHGANIVALGKFLDEVE